MIEKIRANDDVKNFLLRDEAVNLSPLNFLENIEDAVVLIYNGDVENGVIIGDAGMMDFILATRNRDFLREFWEFAPPGHIVFNGVPRDIADIFLEDKTPEWQEPCKSYALLGEFAPIAADYPYEALKPQDAAEVDKYYTYRGDWSEKELRRCIETLDSACIRIDGELAAWCLIHADGGTLGPLYTKEKYRRRGLAEIVSSRLIEKVLAAGKTPHLQIAEGNHASFSFLQKFPGFVHTHDCVWFGVISKKTVENARKP